MVELLKRRGGGGKPFNLHALQIPKVFVEPWSVLEARVGKVTEAYQHWAMIRDA